MLTRSGVRSSGGYRWGPPPWLYSFSSPGWNELIICVYVLPHFSGRLNSMSSMSAIHLILRLSMLLPGWCAVFWSWLWAIVLLWNENCVVHDPCCGNIGFLSLNHSLLAIQLQPYCCYLLLLLLIKSSSHAYQHQPKQSPAPAPHQNPKTIA